MVVSLPLGRWPLTEYHVQKMNPRGESQILILVVSRCFEAATGQKKRGSPSSPYPENNMMRLAATRSWTLNLHPALQWVSDSSFFSPLFSIGRPMFPGKEDHLLWMTPPSVSEIRYAHKIFLRHAVDTSFQYAFQLQLVTSFASGGVSCVM